MPLACGGQRVTLGIQFASSSVGSLDLTQIVSLVGQAPSPLIHLSCPGQGLKASGLLGEKNKTKQEGKGSWSQVLDFAVAPRC